MGARIKNRIDISAVNDRELSLALKALPDSIAQRSVADALKKSGTPILKAARRNARKIKDTGLLAKSMGRKNKTYRSKKYARLKTHIEIIGPRRGFKKAVVRKFTLKDGRVIEKHEIADPAHYAHLVEFGTQAHSLGKDSQLHRGMRMQFGGPQHPGTAPQPFLRPAYDETRESSVHIYRTEIRAAIVRNWEKAKRKIERRIGKKAGTIVGYSYGA